MELFKLTTPKDDAWKVIETLGHADLVQFLNMTENVEITRLIYQDRIKICEETDRRILFLLNTCREYLIKINKPTDPAMFSRNLTSIEQTKKKSHDLLFDAIETEVRDCESFVCTQRETIDEIKSNIDKLQDYLEVVKFINSMAGSLGGARPAVAAGDVESNPAAEQMMDNTLKFVAGTIKRDEMERMKRMLFRITRGKALTHFNGFMQDNVEKVAYLVIFSGSGGNQDRVQKICDSFLGQRFEVPDMSGLNTIFKETEIKINKSRSLYETSVGQLKDYLYEMNNSSSTHQEDTGISTLEIYKWFVAKEKAIYNAMNMLKLHNGTFIGYMWIPSEKQGIVAQKLQEFSTTEFTRWRDANGKGPIPPSSFKTNDMLEFHQITVDTYKYATYGEINPAIFQVITFPFFFAVMYGDMGHGSLFLLLGIILCLFEGQLRKMPAMKGLLVTRYFWLMMGFFSVYMGLLYNEFFSISADWFGTCYDVAAFDPKDAATQRIPPYAPGGDCVYAFGMDPTWKLSSNYLTYSNNIKEKLAVIIAYFHLNFGIVLNAMNTIRNGQYKKLFFDIFTGFFIFLGLIGYMIVLIFVKWWYPVNSYDAPPAYDALELTISTSPSIIVVVIGDVMGLTGFAAKNPDSLQWFDGQQTISNILVYITFLFLPVMLCAIPCIHICCGPKHEEHGEDGFQAVAAHNRDEDESAKMLGNDEDIRDSDIRDVEEMLKQHSPKEGNHDSTGEIFIHQVIETIEFVLGCISNTASYLRLWALSLAHGQLGEVFLTIFFTQFQSIYAVKDMSSAVATIYFFVLSFGYMFAVMCVLLMMDVLEVFLHTMRLHWVEFMGKFYQGAGLPYKPFSFNEVFEKERSRVDVQ